MKRLNTEWHHYKSGRTGQIVGAYFYLPDQSDKNLAHVYKASHEGAHWYVTSFVPGVSFKDRAYFSLEQAKRDVAREMRDHYEMNPQKAFAFVNNPL